MVIDILCNDGSPLGVTSRTLFGDQFRVGLGGSEYALITMCEEWTKIGHKVTLYNNPFEPNASPFEQRPITAFAPQDDRDVLIVFRSPNAKAIPAKGLKVWWSCDQMTVGNFAGYAQYMNKIICISPCHAKYFADNYRITNTTIIDLPIRLEDFKGLKFGKIKNRLIFTSVPARGLDNLWRIYPKIQAVVPDVNLVITADYRLWGTGAGNEQFRVNWMHRNNVSFLGAIPRGQLIEEQMKADLLVYPCNYEELFCISVAEAQCLGAYPVTSNSGALETTNMGTVLYGNSDNVACDTLFVDTVVGLLQDRKSLEIKRAENKVKARKRFDPKNIVGQWEAKAFK